MARLELATPHGALLVVGEHVEECRAAAELALAEPFLPRNEAVPFLAGRAWFKRDVLRGRSRVRHALKALFGRPAPRLCEHANLTWLRDRLFQTPRPIAAGYVRARGLPSVQFLLTEEVPRARTLDEFLRDTSEAARVATVGAQAADTTQLSGGAQSPDGSTGRTAASFDAEDERADVLEEIAREVARMHSLRFLHHDLYPRNLLVAERGTISRVHFIDAWAGGPAPNLRGAEYDLACFLLRASETLTAPERERFLERYVAERAAQERPVERAPFEAAVGRERRKLIARLARRPNELRGEPLPRLDL